LISGRLKTTENHPKIFYSFLRKNNLKEKVGEKYFRRILLPHLFSGWSFSFKYFGGKKVFFRV